MDEYSDFKILLDEPTKNPKLGFKEYGKALADVIEHSSPQFAIGIFGDWGSGKTTLMRFIESLISEEPKMVPVWFNAWRYEREEHLIVPMLDVLREALKERADSEKDTGKKEAALAAAATVARAGRALLAGFKMSGKFVGVGVDFEPSKALEDWKKSDEEAADSTLSFYHASFNSMRKAVTEFSDKGAQRIVVFVDDLDRCLPGNALEVLESMKLLFDQEGFVFVVGLNKDIIERSIKLKYQTPGLKSEELQPIKGTDYVKKIFQVPFGLPQISMEQLQTYFDGLVNDSDLPTLQKKDLEDIVRPHLNYLSEDGSVNPREVKRFINSYTLQLKMMKPKLGDELVPNVILGLQVMSFRPAWFNLYDAMAVDPALFQEAVRNAIKGAGAGSVLNLPGSQVPLPMDFVTYVGGPSGQSLLTANLDVYLSSAESTRSSAPGLLKAQAEVAKIRGHIDRVANGEEPSNYSSAVASSLSVVKKETSQTSSPLARPIDLDAGKLEAGFTDSTDLSNQDQRDQWVTEMKTAIKSIDQNVSELRRQASFGTS